MSFIVLVEKTFFTYNLPYMHVIQQLKDLEKILPTDLSSNDWILFDIDYTLTTPDHPALHMGAIKQNRQRYFEELNKFNDNHKLIIPILMITHVTNKLTEPDGPELIKKFEKRATVFGFTAADTGAFPQIGEIPNWRSKELARLGIAFNPLFSKERIEFREFPSFRQTYPIYQDGVLYSNVIPSKGIVMKAFIEKVGIKPNRVFLIDDKPENLVTMQEELNKMGISFSGVRYSPNFQLTEPISETVWKEIWDAIRERAHQIS